MRLFIDGKIEGEQFLTFLLTKNSNPKCPRKISLFSVGGDGYSVQGFIKCAEVLPASDHVEHHYIKVLLNSYPSLPLEHSCSVFVYFQYFKFYFSIFARIHL